MKAKDDPELKALLNRAEFQIPDGIGVIIASKLQKGNITSRVTGVDMMDRVVREAARTQKSIFLYGAKPGIADKAAAKLIETYPDLIVAGTQDGYEKDNSKVIDSINKAQPDILFVAMGSPKQEQWIEQYRDELAPDPLPRSRRLIRCPCRKRQTRTSHLPTLRRRVAIPAIKRTKPPKTANESTKIFIRSFFPKMKIDSCNLVKEMLEYEL